MYLIIETGGKFFSLYLRDDKNVGLLSKDPFFGAQLPDLKVYSANEPIGLLLEESRSCLLEDSAISHFPFFISSLLGSLLLKENVQFLHGAAFMSNSILYILLGEIGVGKSTMLYQLLQVKKGSIQILCDDKIVLNFSRGAFISGNQWLSIRGEEKEDLNEKSCFTKKNYLQLKRKNKGYFFSSVRFIKLVDAPNLLPEEISTRELILNLYHNILNLASGNQACSLSPLLTYGVAVNQEDKDNLLRNLLKYIHSKNCLGYQCDKGDLNFILSLINSSGTL